MRKLWLAFGVVSVVVVVIATVAWHIIFVPNALNTWQKLIGSLLIGTIILSLDLFYVLLVNLAFYDLYDALRNANNDSSINDHRIWTLMKGIIQATLKRYRERQAFVIIGVWSVFIGLLLIGLVTTLSYKLAVLIAITYTPIIVVALVILDMIPTFVLFELDDEYELVWDGKEEGVTLLEYLNSLIDHIEAGGELEREEVLLESLGLTVIRLAKALF